MSHPIESVTTAAAYEQGRLLWLAEGTAPYLTDEVGGSRSRAVQDVRGRGGRGDDSALENQLLQFTPITNLGELALGLS